MTYSDIDSSLSLQHNFHENEELPAVVTKLQAIGRALLPLLPASVEDIELSYYGQGDDGEIGDLQILPPKDIPDGPERIWQYDWEGPGGIRKGDSYQPTKEINHCELPEVVSVTYVEGGESVEYTADELEEQLMELVFELLYNHHPGWEISEDCVDGSAGELRLSFPSLRVSLSHSAKLITSEDSYDEWEVNA